MQCSAAALVWTIIKGENPMNFGGHYNNQHRSEWTPIYIGQIMYVPILYMHPNTLHTVLNQLNNNNNNKRGEDHKKSLRQPYLDNFYKVWEEGVRAFEVIYIFVRRNFTQNSI